MIVRFLKSIKLKEELLVLIDTRQRFLVNDIPAILVSNPHSESLLDLLLITPNDGTINLAVKDDFFLYNNCEVDVEVDPCNTDNKQFVVLRCIAGGNIFYSMSHERGHDHSKLANGEVAYHVIAFCDSIDEAKQRCQEALGIYRTKLK